MTDIDIMRTCMQESIKEFLEKAEDDLAKAQKENNLEGIVSYQFLVNEYETMLEEFNEYYNV